MCYFDDVPCVRDEVLPRRRAIRAWKGFDGGRWGLCSPWYETYWKSNKPQEATEHGFYAVHRKPLPHTAEVALASQVRRVLLWGWVREYRNEHKHGYRAQYCLVLPLKRAKRRVKQAT